ncbi:MAG: HAMP domain-containing sensor histidine kinase [Halioglobus sp.]
MGLHPQDQPALRSFSPSTKGINFALVSAALMLCTVLLTRGAANHHTVFVLLNEFVLVLGGLYFLTFIGIWYAIAFIALHLVTTLSLLALQSLATEYSNHIFSYLTIVVICIPIEISMRKPVRFAWPQVASIMLVAGLFFNLLGVRIIGALCNALELLTVYGLSIDVFAFAIVYIIYITLPDDSIYAWRKQKIESSIFSHLFVGVLAAAVLIFTILSSLTIQNQVDGLVDSIEKRLEIEAEDTVEDIARFFSSMNHFALQQTYFVREMGEISYSQLDREMFSVTAPQVNQIRIGDSEVSSHLIYGRDDKEQNNFNDSTTFVVPCIANVFSCEFAMNSEGYNYKTNAGPLGYLYTYGDYKDLRTTVSLPYVINLKKDNLVVIFKSADDLEEKYFFDADIFRQRDIAGNDLHKRAWIVTAGKFPEVGIRLTKKLKHVKEGSVTVYASIRNELLQIRSNAYKAFEIFLLLVLAMQVVGFVCVAFFTKRVTQQLARIERWYLDTNYELDVNLSRIPEINELFRRIQTAAKAYRIETSEKMELGRLLLLEHRQLTELLDTAGEFSVLLIAEDGEIIVANQSSCELLSVEQGMNINVVASETPPRSSDILLARVIEQCETLQRDASLIKFEEEFSPINNNEESSHWLIGLHKHRALDAESGDYHNRIMVWIRNINELVLARSQADHADRLTLLGETVAGMAHEMNQPLNVITLAAENCEVLLRSDATDKEKVIKRLHKIKNQVQRAAELITSIKGHGTAEREQEVLFDINDAVEFVAHLLSPQLELQGILLEVTIGRDRIQAAGSKTKLEQVLSNIIINARDAILLDADRLRVKEICVTVSQSSKTLIAISNFGETIPEAVVNKIFNPFFTTKKRSDDSGMGLGLSICARLVNELGGSITVESYGRKTTFFVTLPSVSREKVDDVA